jgi:hypothetical protein
LDKRADPPSYTKNRKQQQAEQTRAAMKRATDGESVALPRKKLAKRRNNNIRKSTIGDNITVDESSTRTPKIHIKSDLAASSSSKRKAIQDEDSKQDHDEEMVEVEVIEDRMDAIINKEVRKITEEKQKVSNDEGEQTDAENTQVEEDDETTQVEKSKPVPRVLANDNGDSESDYESEDGYGAQDQEQEDDEDDEDDEDEEEDEEDEEDDLDGPTQVEHRNVADYKSLPEDVQKELEYIARKKVELEEKALLNPDLNEDALKISEEMEKWMEDDSILKAAESLGNILKKQIA